MKKIIIFAKTKHDCLKKYQEIAKKQAVSIDIIINFEKMKISYIGQKSEIFFNNKNLSSYDLVYFYSTGNAPRFQTQELIMLISQFSKEKKIPIVDKALEFSSPWVDSKSFEYLRLVEKGLPIIDSVFVDKNSYKNIKEINYPMIAKITSSSQGDGVFFVKSEKKLKTLIDKYNYLMIQKYVKSNFDFRLLVVGNKVIASIVRHNQILDKFEEKNILAKKSKQHKVSKKEASLAIKAVKTLNYQIAGVDLIYSKNNKLKVIEVNRSPQFKTTKRENHINIEEKIVDFLVKSCK